MTENLSIGPFVLTGPPRALRHGDAAVDLAAPALGVLAAIARSLNGISAAQLWPLVSSEPHVDEDRLCDLVGDINTALGRWSPDWYVAWYPEHAVPGFALVDATRRASPATALPALRTDVFGREETIARVVAQLASHRFVTILAAGGMGKTTVALAAAHAAAASYPDGVHVVDLAPIVDDALVLPAVAAAVGCIASGPDPLAVLRQWGRDRRALVVLDSCEHVIDAASVAAETLAGAGPGLAVLATSREPLRAFGEWLHRLPPMRLPQPGEAVSARDAAGFSALRLFIERASAADAGFVLRDADVPQLVALCTRLDGIALAIEIVAARVDTLGLAGLASQLEGRLLGLPGRRRTGPERHATLAALLDWSFQLLSDAERTVLRRLSVFRNGFTMAMAAEVVGDAQVDAADVQDGLLDLIAKSLVAPPRGGDGERLRLLDTTRAYAGAKLAAAGERDAIHRRHALWLAAALAESERSWNRMTRPQWVERHAPLIDDIRAALDWAFGPGGDAALGTELTISGFALARQMALVDEYLRRVDAAIERLSAQPGSADAALDASSPLMRLNFLVACLGGGGSNGPSARWIALAPTIARATTALGDSSDLVHRFAAVNSMWAFSVARGDFRAGATWSDRLVALAGTSDDPVAHLVANRIQAQTLHFTGRHAQAATLAQHVIGEAWRTIPLVYNPSPIELRVSMRVVLARALWMQGLPDRAAAMALEAMEQARTDSPLAQCQVIVLGALPVALWSGDEDTARALAARLVDIERQLAFGHWLHWARRMRDEVALRSGDAVAGSDADDFFHETEPLLADQLATLADRWLTPRCIQRVEAGLVGWCAPEALRRQGERGLRERTPAGDARGEDFLQRSLALARAQGAASWELRTSTSLARHWLSRDRAGEARALLEPVLAGFAEGRGTADWRAAESLLATP